MNEDELLRKKVSIKNNFESVGPITSIEKLDEIIHSSLDKISQVRKMIDATGKDIRLEVDGGINNETIGLASKAGADTFVAGSAIFNTDNYEQTIKTLRSKIL